MGTKEQMEQLKFKDDLMDFDFKKFENENFGEDEEEEDPV